MAALLLAVIYMSFISLGLPDSLLGAAWPAMRLGLGAPLSGAGLISMIIAGGTIVSSLLSDRLVRRFGAGMVTAVSVLLTAVALLCFSFSGVFWLICVFALPYGLGAGAIDAALNNYVAQHYNSRHMNWLHCFWGVGAAISPYIMGYCLGGGFGWQRGYQAISVIQFALAVLLLASLPLWKKHKAPSDNATHTAAALPISSIVRLRGVAFVLPAFFAYCALEMTAGLWASSYLVKRYELGSETAARYASLFFLGITAGRFFSGFISEKVGSRRMIRAGSAVMLAGFASFVLPNASAYLALIGLVVAGLGCAPVYPAIIHATPRRFGAEHAQVIIGLQMASAYAGSTLIPPLFGLLAERIGLWLFPFFLIAFALTMFILTECVNRAVAEAEAGIKSR